MDIKSIKKVVFGKAFIVSSCVIILFLIVGGYYWQIHRHKINQRKMEVLRQLENCYFRISTLEAKEKSLLLEHKQLASEAKGIISRTNSERTRILHGEKADAQDILETLHDSKRALDTKFRSQDILNELIADKEELLKLEQVKAELEKKLRELDRLNFWQSLD